MPEGYGFDKAAAIPLTGLTAWQGITEELQAEPGMTLLITGGSGSFGQKVAAIVSESLSKDIEQVDLMDGGRDFSEVLLDSSGIAVIAVPSFGGRVPAPAAERIARIRANGAKAVLVCVYGNRAYEDTLVELQDTAKQAGFQVICGIAAIAEHSIVRRFATGRPDDIDRAALSRFASEIKRKVDTGDCSEPRIPGDRPYKKAGKAGMVPKPDEKCTECGLCAGKCPVGAIDGRDPRKVDKAKCISCMGCVSVCPHGARGVNGIMLLVAGAMLKKACSQRKECEIYL